MFMKKLPNLELLLYKARQAEGQDRDFQQKLKDENIYTVSLDYEVMCFPQWWGSTCTGFDATTDNDPVFSGSAMTKEYTTIVHEIITETYWVFFGDRLCYKVDNPTDEFYEDIKNYEMKSLSKAKKCY